MKIRLFSILFWFSIFSTIMQAQQASQIACVNRADIFNSMPQKKIAEQKMLKLKKQFDAELQLMQSDYNKKYTDFVAYQQKMTEEIRLRRLAELSSLEDQIKKFTADAQVSLTKKETEQLKTINDLIDKAIRSVGIDDNYLIIYDTSDKGIAFVSPSIKDITPLVKKQLNISIKGN